MFYGKDEFNKIMSAERLLFDASMDLSRMLPVMTDLDEAIDDLESVEYQALSAVLVVKEVKAALRVQKDED
ncbi:hypothetical protein [Limosilactobacillus fermentum]|uniref:hypothetical protein n=1 Tax=Limosilactobacillus fermentum TaxID=1613 RepID=UPI003558105F